MLASGVDRVFNVVGEEERPVSHVLVDSMKPTKKITVNNSYSLYAVYRCFK